MLHRPARSTLVVTAPAADLTLLTEEERREAAGLAAADTSKDEALEQLDERISAAICSYCNIAIGGGGEPTLRKETLTETFYGVRVDSLILARRHNVTIASVVQTPTPTVELEYIVDPESAIVTRLCDFHQHPWHASKLVVVYDAGFETIPGDLKFAAIDFFRSTWLAKSRDPLVKLSRTEIYEVQTEIEEYWVGSVPGQSNEGAVPDIVAGQLKRFRNSRV